MRKKRLDIFGGATVAKKKELLRMQKLLGLVVLLLLTYSSSAFAQGSIFGTVQNSNLTTPANGEISFYGFTNNTDDEIRLESSIGAGYDAGNWFDDFQNYLSKTPGNPYMYRFLNTSNGEGAVLSSTIPNNSFQQENISLGTVTWPATPTGMSARVISSTSIVLTWTRVAGITYHVYRRPSTSQGSFFRIDNTAGLLTDAGEVDSFFVDNTVSGGGSFDYLLIPQNGSGALGPHSGILTVSTATPAAPAIASITPNSGSSLGGTAVVIAGTGFDVNGVSVTLDGAPLTSVTVVSPFQVNAVTPAGTGGTADLVVQNTASTLSATLLAGFTYLGNQAPVLAAIGAQSVAEGSTLNLGITATDGDGTIPALTTSTLPLNASFTDNGNGTGSFSFSPNLAQAGQYSVTFYASDGTAIDSEVVAITVTNVNQAPVLAAIGPRSVNEGANLNFVVSATDADGSIPAFTTTLPLPVNATFIDNGNGTGTFNFNPNFAQAGTINVSFYASDGTAIDSEQVVITVNNVNQLPVLAAIGAQLVTEGQVLNMGVSATDADGTTPILTTSTLPLNASFTDNGNGTGSFSFSPSFVQAGPYSVTFYASDGVAIDSEVVAITVNEAGNQTPVLASIGPRSIAEGATLAFGVSATDVDGTTPTLTTSTLPTNASFINNGNGTGSFSFTPDFTQAGPYSVTFYASDGVAIDSEVVAITVTDGGNQAPVLAAIGARSGTEGQLLTFGVSATDIDGTIPTFSTSTLAANASFVDNGNGTGTFNFTPDFTQAGVYNITFRASDGVLVDSEVVAITIGEVGNQAPVLAAIGPQSTAENQLLSFGVSATDADATIPALTTSTLPANASFVDNGNGTGTFNFTPSFAQSGPHSISFYASDGVLIDSEVVAITVTNVNQDPILAAIGAQNVTEGQLLTVNITASDADGNIPVLSTSALPTNAGFVDNGNGTGTLSFTPSFTQAGPYSITFYASDGVATDSEIVAITVTEAGNQAPVLASIGPRGVSEGNTLAFVVSASDVDAEIPALTILGLPLNATFIDNGNGTGSFSFTPALDQSGIHQVTFIATDAALAADSEVVVITVTETNQVPVLATIGAQNVTEGQLLSFRVSATDGDGVIPDLTTSTLPAGASFIDSLNGAGSFSWTPGFVVAGVYTVTFRAADGIVTSDVDSEVVTITVLDAGNQTPVLAAIGPRLAIEGQTLAFVVTATDPENSPLTMTADPLPLNATFTDNGDGTGSFSFSPSFTQAGSYPVTFVASDGLAADSELVVVTVNESGNVSPVITAIPDTSVSEGAVLVINISAIDPDSPFAPAIAVSAASLRNFTFVDNGNGTAVLTYSPDYIDAGADTVRFFATDGTSSPGSETAVITTIDVNLPPFFRTVTSKQVQANDSIRFTVTAVDSTDPGWPRRLFLTATGIPAGANFLDNGNNTGTFSWAPTSLQVGTYNVVFYATDQGIPNLAGSMAVQVQVVPVNNPPQLNLASAEARKITEGQTLIVAISATDPDGGAPSIEAQGLPANASIVPTGPGTANLEFTPDFTQGGNTLKSKLYSVTIIASDGSSTDKSVITIQVTDAGNQPPSFDTIPAPSITEGTTDTAFIYASDPDGGSVTLTAINSTLPTNSDFVDAGGGVGLIIFSPGFTQAGIYNIGVIANDGTLVDTAFVTITIVEAGNQPPVLATITDKTVMERAGLVFRVFGTDPDGTRPTLSTGPLPTGAVFVDSANGAGSFTWVPTNFQAGAYPIMFYAEDFSVPGDFDSQLVNITVVDSNIAPIIFATGGRTINEGDTLRYVITAADEDLTTPSIYCRLTTADSLATNMSFVDSGNGVGVLTFMPDYTQGGNGTVGNTQILYNVYFIATDETDPTLTTQTSAVQITVRHENAPPSLVMPAGPGPFTINEGTTLSFPVASGDPDGGLPTITAQDLPVNSTFSAGLLSRTFTFTPDFTQAGTYVVRFYATDAGSPPLTDSEYVTINVTDAGNQPSRFSMALPDTMNIATNVLTEFVISAADPERGQITLSVNQNLPNAVFVDSGNGVGSYSITPDSAALGAVYDLLFFATDPQSAVDTVQTHLRVVNFLRGDLDQNGKYSLIDLAVLVNYLLRQGDPPTSMQAADINGDSRIDLSDLAFMLNFFYGGGDRPPQ